MKTTTQIGSGRTLFALPDDKFMGAASEKLKPSGRIVISPNTKGVTISGLRIHPSTNAAPPVDMRDLEGRN